MYDTREDNLIIEAPVIFGSGLQVRVSAKLRVPGTGYAVYLPVEVSSIQVTIAALHSLHAMACHPDMDACSLPTSPQDDTATPKHSCGFTLRYLMCVRAVLCSCGQWRASRCRQSLRRFPAWAG